MSRSVRSGWSRTILVCAKCTRKLGGGFGPKRKTRLAKALRRELGLRKGRKAAAGIVEVKCLGVCPKHAVCMVDAENPRVWSLVPEGADVGEVACELGLFDAAAV